MNFFETICDLLKKEENLANCVELQRSSALPEKCYFLDKDTVLCYPRTTGDSRYPYCADGFTLWAYSSGYMSLNESTFYCILPADEGKEPYVNFFAGLKNADGGYTPVSLTGAARQPQEKAKRFCVYTPEAVYYVTKTDGAAFCLRAFVSPDKQACFSVGAVNLGNEKEIYLSALFNCLFMHQAGENVETKWFKQCNVTQRGFLFQSVEDLDRTTHLENFGVINRNVNAKVNYLESTTSRSDYVGGKTNCQNCATPLFSGHFEKRKSACKFTDTAAAGDICQITLQQNGFAEIDYVLEVYFDAKEANEAVRAVSDGFCDELVRRAKQSYDNKSKSETALAMTFENSTDGALNGDVLTKFVHNVMRQTEFAALAKNSGVSLLGVRDVTQQLEAALMWNPKDSREKFCELLNFIDPCGRPPRQYSLPAKGALPQMDTRAFIDQGVWIISAVYNYLAFTGDYSILDEICGYYKIVGHNRVEHVEERNSVFEHLTRICDYLIENIDGETNCLKALYGDWNDALDGLGVSTDPDREYGNGVSVMATLQLLRNVREMQSITETVGDRLNKGSLYRETEKRLTKGLKTYCIDTDKKGNRKVLHGWGDKREYKVGSFCDVDGVARDGLAANAFWVISDAYLWDTSIKKDILASYGRLDSKYGLKTFEPYFKRGTKGVGRIVNLPKGTAENAATYIHATMFGICSLLKMGESKLAWEQLYKVLPLTHELVSTTPFIMSNSYSYNTEFGMDGESMSDWFTGSANVLIKMLVWYMFGVRPTLKGVEICPANYLPFEKASISLSIRGKRIDLTMHGGGKIFEMDGKPAQTEYDEARLSQKLFIPFDKLKDCKIEIK
ncbi:MAG: hypothetical protein NC132_03630 [Corallococcus sp.]|nr:hypothetical protein [Corallococcus sp.]MCM1359592.1 hypothetical protein [Corallococcus sp.]MCM1395184.1 hypothetical protein [Corallococcus sp.]